jgi:xanthine dehydrogenase accessory factor
MPCGGHMRVFVEPVMPDPVLWLLGRGALVETLSALAARLHFEVVVLDALASPAAHPAAARIITDDSHYASLSPGPGDYVLIATHHKGDYAALHRCLASSALYIGLVASRRRGGIIIERLRREGVGEGELARIQTPAGLDLGAIKPQEIALSVLAEMVRIRRQGKGGPLAVD